MSDFTQAVAKRAGVNADQAADVLARHGVRESGILPKPHRLLITSIAFTGKKSGTSTGSINFEWHLASGLWCLAADNLRGKSSVLEVIWWCLRGESNLQADVRRWIHRVRLTGQVDDEPFTVAVDAVDDQLIGSLEIGAQGQATNFTGEQEFSATMGAFMMDRLGLEPLRGWRRDTAGSPAEPEEADGQLTVTGWPAYSHALMCRNRENDALLGETAAGGTMISLLQMFVGLPWTTTRRDASAALEVLRQGLRGERRRAQQDLDARGIGVEELEKRLAEAKRVAAQMDVRSLETAVGDVETLGAKLTEMTARHAELVQQSSIAQQQADDLRETLTADRSRLRDLRETAVAQRFFGALKPTCCPRCSTTLDKLAHADLGELHCGLCGSEPTAPLGDNGAAEELAAAIDILQGAYREARQAAQQTAAAVQASSATLEAIRTAFRDAQAGLPQEASLRAHLAVARLEGALAERHDALSRAQPKMSTVEETILEAARKEADVRAKAASQQLLERVSSEICRLAVRLGMSELQEIKLLGNGTLNVTKGNSRTVFTKVTPGEQLRLRIATLLALLRVGHEFGVGRHPGLLLLDSAGAQETKASDLAEVLSQLQTICQETDGLQMITATANREVAANVVSSDRLRVSAPGEAVW